MNDLIKEFLMCFNEVWETFTTDDWKYFLGEVKNHRKEFENMISKQEELFENYQKKTNELKNKLIEESRNLKDEYEYPIEEYIKLFNEEFTNCQEKERELLDEHISLCEERCCELISYVYGYMMFCKENQKNKNNEE